MTEKICADDIAAILAGTMFGGFHQLKAVSNDGIGERGVGQVPITAPETASSAAAVIGASSQLPPFSPLGDDQLSAFGSMRGKHLCVRMRSGAMDGEWHRFTKDKEKEKYFNDWISRARLIVSLLDIEIREKESFGTYSIKYKGASEIEYIKGMCGVRSGKLYLEGVNKASETPHIMAAYFRSDLVRDANTRNLSWILHRTTPSQRIIAAIVVSSPIENFHLPETISDDHVIGEKKVEEFVDLGVHFVKLRQVVRKILDSAPESVSTDLRIRV